MRLRPPSLIICSIIVFLLDFLILANKTIFPDSTVVGFPAVVVAFVCALVFISGIIWAIIKSISGKTKNATFVTTATPTKSMPIPDRFALTPMEIVFNRVFAFLLIFTTIPYILNIFTLPTIIIYVIFAIFLWFGKKYHLFANIIFLIFALGAYFVPITPIAWGFFHSLKEFRLNGFNFVFPVLWLIPLSIFISFAVRNLLGNIFAYFKNVSILRNTFYLTSLLIVFTVTMSYPLLDSVKLRERTENINTAACGDLGIIYTKQSLTFLDRYHMAGNFTSKFDSSSKKYIYHLQLQEPLKKEIRFTKVEIDGEKINFTSDNRIKCSNCQKDGSNPFSLVFPAGKSIDFILTSDKLIRIITFTEPEDKANKFIFWK